MSLLSSRKHLPVLLVIAAGCLAPISVARAGFSAFVPVGEPLDVFEFRPTDSALAPSYIAFHVSVTGDGDADPSEDSLDVTDTAFSESQNYDAYPLAAYDIFTADGHEIYDNDVGAYDDIGNTFFAGGTASWTGTGYLEYDGSAFPAGFGGTADVTAMDLFFYSRVAIPSAQLNVTLTTTTLSDQIIGDEDPMETGTFIYDPNGFGNPVSAAAATAPDATATLLLLTLACVGLAGVRRGRRIVV
jgi:hypothetical protein